MRILHVAASYLPAVRYGGTIVSVHGLAKALAARGHDVHVFTTSVDGPVDSPVPLATPVDLAAAGLALGVDYPLPLVDHEAARERSLQRYAVVRRAT